MIHGSSCQDLKIKIYAPRNGYSIEKLIKVGTRQGILTTRNCAQKEGTDYIETFPPVVKYTSIRYLLSLAVKEKLQITHMDVTTTYLNSDLKDEICVKPPSEIEGIKPRGN